MSPEDGGSRSAPPPPPGAPPPDQPDRPLAGGPPDRASPVPPVPFSVLDGLILVAWTLVAQVVTGGIVLVPALLAGLDPTDPTLLAVTTVVGGVITIAGALLWLWLQGKLDRRVGGPQVPDLGHVAWGIGAGVGGLVIVYGYQIGMQALLGPVEPPSQSVLELITSAGPLAAGLSIAAAVLLAPVVEELVFRGVLFQALRSWLGVWPGIVVSAALFALAHVELYVLTGDPSIVALGALTMLAGWFAWVFHRLGTLTVPMIAHAVFNGAVIVVALLAPVG